MTLTAITVIVLVWMVSIPVIFIAIVCYIERCIENNNVFLYLDKLQYKELKPVISNSSGYIRHIYDINEQEKDYFNQIKTAYVKHFERRLPFLNWENVKNVRVKKAELTIMVGCYDCIENIIYISSKCRWDEMVDIFIHELGHAAMSKNEYVNKYLPFEEAIVEILKDMFYTAKANKCKKVNTFYELLVYVTLGLVKRFGFESIVKMVYEETLEETLNEILKKNRGMKFILAANVVKDFLVYHNPKESDTQIINAMLETICTLLKKNKDKSFIWEIVKECNCATEAYWIPQIDEEHLRKAFKMK